MATRESTSPVRTQTSGVAAPLWAILAVTALCSLSTGIMWAGVPFVLKYDYGYSQVAVLWMMLFVSVFYIGGAFASGPLLRRLSAWMSARTMLMSVLAVQGALCFLPIMVAGVWAVWLVVASISLISSLLWPVVESYLTAGRHGRVMRNSIGWWNVAWTGSVAMSLVMMAPLISEETPIARYSIVVVGIAGLVAMAILLRWPAEPPAHDETESIASVGREYVMLLRSARILLPLSYVLIGVISPIMPYLLERVQVTPVWETPTAAVWMVARVGAIIVMWRLHFWHGRWGALLAGGGMMLGAFIMLVMSEQLWTMLLALTIFGAAQGVIYYLAIYYAMSVGRAAVEAGGVHEALIGLGYVIGPLATLTGMGVATQSGGVVAESPAIILVVMVVIALAVMPTLQPYLRARRLREHAAGGAASGEDGGA